MDAYDPRRRRSSRARERHEARKGKKEGAMATPREGTPKPREIEPVESRQLPQPLQQFLQGLNLWLRDAWWYATHRPHLARGVVILGLIVFGIFVLSRLFSGRIYPNVWALGVSLDGMTVEEAAVALVNAWNDDVRIEIMVEGKQLAQIAPAELGLSIDSLTAAENARAIGLSGIPFGYTVDVPISLEEAVAEDYLLAQAPKINSLPYNAGYALEDGQVVGVPGREGRELDIALTLERIAETTEQILRTRRIDVLTLPIAPDFIDPEPLLEDATRIAAQDFMLTGYDPFTDERITWATKPQTVITWLEAGPGRLNVRQNAFKTFIDLLNETIAKTDSQRYVDFNEALQQVEKLIAEEEQSAFLRMRQRDMVYTIESGDFAYRLARRFGLPFHLIAQANPGRDLDNLSVGDQINLPSPDAVVPETPIPNKRIIVDLDRQYLWAFENGQQVFEWPISSGMNSYPTYPGVFQIISHEPKAYGSSFTMCSEVGDCSQWEMDWFMGIYEVAPALQNGFHGNVLLANGALLNGGSVGNKATFGCVMSVNENAKALYDWADKGTMVEIVSDADGYTPRSILAKQVKNLQIQVNVPQINS